VPNELEFIFYGVDKAFETALKWIVELSEVTRFDYFFNKLYED
jgi:hypothetical protein